MGRLRTRLPKVRDHLAPRLPDHGTFKERDQATKHRQTTDYNHHHFAQPLRILQLG